MSNQRIALELNRMNNNKSITLSLISIFLCVAPYFALAQQTVLDRIVAVVGKECILLSDLNDKVDFYVFNNRVDPNTPALKERVLDEMVNEKLIFAKALEDTTISVSDDEVTNQLDALVTQQVQQAGSEKRLEEIYHMPISRMKLEWRDEQRKELMKQKLIDAKFREIKASRSEVEDLFAQYKDSLPKVQEELEIYHIFKLPKVSEAARSKVRLKVQVILDSIKAGGDFADFARRYSEDPGSAVGGGDLGFVRRGQFLKEFEEAVFALKENQFADIVETSLGLHIIQLLERRGESVRVRHILFKIERDVAEIDSTIAFLKGLKDSILQGASFSELAKQYSEDKESGPLGGLLGKLTVDQFDKSLLRTVSTMKEGDISDPVEVAYGLSTGYHIVYLKRRIPEHSMNLNNDWQRLEQLATAYKKNQEYQKWITQLRKEMYWDIRLQ
jgi:peptidyl-prolyl cis-trans isomerase SurA